MRRSGETEDAGEASADHVAETLGGESGRLARHCADQAVTFLRGGRVDLAAATDDACKKLHFNSPCNCWIGHTERLRMMEWGGSSDADIGARVAV